MAAEWWQLAEGWELYDWSLFVDIPAPVEGSPDLGGSSPRRRSTARTAVYATATATLPRPVLVSSATPRPPAVIQPAPARASELVVGSARALLGAALVTSPATSKRRTFATSTPQRLAAPAFSAAATGSVWTQLDEEAELMMLGLFA